MTCKLFCIPVRDKDEALNLRHIKGMQNYIYHALGRKAEYLNATDTIMCKWIKYCNT